MTDIITTRRLERSDIDGVLDLLRASLGEPPLLERTPELFLWKHFENPFGPSIALVAESGGRLAGLRAFMRWQLRTPRGEIVECGRAVDTATHPNFQRRGIFRRLTEEALEEATSAGLDLIFNTPNPQSGAGYLKMGWSIVGKVGALVRPKARILRRRHEHNQLDPGAAIRDAIPAGAIKLDDRPPIGLRTPRSADYLAWRYESHPTARYLRVDGKGASAVVRPNVRRGRDELLVTEVFGPNPGSALRVAARRARTDYVGGWFSKGSPERAACIRSGLLPVPGASPLTLMARPLHADTPDVSSMERWDLSLGDLELL